MGTEGGRRLGTLDASNLEWSALCDGGEVTLSADNNGTSAWCAAPIDGS